MPKKLVPFVWIALFQHLITICCTMSIMYHCRKMNQCWNPINALERDNCYLRLAFYEKLEKSAKYARNASELSRKTWGNPRL